MGLFPVTGLVAPGATISGFTLVMAIPIMPALSRHPRVERACAEVVAVDRTPQAAIPFFAAFSMARSIPALPTDESGSRVRVHHFQAALAADHPDVEDSR